MTVRELYNTYKDYDIEVFGRPLDTPTIPFTLLPKDKNMNDCEVVDMRIEECNHENMVFSLNGSFKRKEIKKGYIQVYVK